MIHKVVELGRRGATDLEIAAELGVAVSTLYEWRKSNVAFSESLKAGKQIADVAVQQSLYNRAVGFTGPDGQYHPPHPTAIVFWLKNRQPAEWRDTTRSEITGADGAAVQLTAGPPRPSAEEIAQHALEMFAGYSDHRDPKTGEAAPLDPEQVAGLGEMIASFATCEGRNEVPPRKIGDLSASVYFIRRVILAETSGKAFVG